MRNDQPSETFKLLYHHIIEELIIQICNQNINYCVRPYIGNDEFPIAIWKKFEEYKSHALQNMSGPRLDRHKLASCICGAIIEVKPLTGFHGATIVRNANEIFALHVGLNVLKFFMMHDLLQSLESSPEILSTVKTYLQENFDMQFPSLHENIRDTKAYNENIANALYWTHHKCELTQKECFHYDIWAYAKIFYHLEIYNRPYFQKTYQEFMDRIQ